MGFRLDSFVISVILFTFLMTSFTLIWNNTTDNYNVTITDDKFSSVYDVSSDMYNYSQDINKKMLEGEIEGGDESWESSVKNSYSAIRLIKDSFTIVHEIFKEVGKTLGVPPFVVGIAITLLTVSIIFSIIYLIFRFKG